MRDGTWKGAHHSMSARLARGGWRALSFSLLLPSVSCFLLLLLRVASSFASTGPPPCSTRLCSAVFLVSSSSLTVTTFNSSLQIAEHLASGFSDETLGLQAEPKQPLIAFIPLNNTTISNGSLYANSHTPHSTQTVPDTVSAEDKLEIAIGMALEGLRSLSQDRSGREKKLIIVAYSSSGSVLSPELVKRCMQAGADAVVRPPYDPIRLTSKVHAAIANSTIRLEAAEQALSGHGNSLTLTPSLSTVPCSSSSATASPNRPAQTDLLTLSDLSAPFANLCSVSTADTFSPRRASVDTGGLALQLSRVTTNQNGHDLGSVGGACRGDGLNSNEVDSDGNVVRNEGGADRHGPIYNEGWTDEKMFAELVAEMHEQVRLAIDVRLEAGDR